MAGKEESMSKKARKRLRMTIFVCSALCEPLRILACTLIQLEESAVMKNEYTRTEKDRMPRNRSKMAGELHACIPVPTLLTVGTHDVLYCTTTGQLSLSFSI